MPTKIQWADETINPLQDKIKGKSGRGYHCTKVSPGCTHCYAEGMNKRFGNGLPFDGRKAEFELVRSELEKPHRWKKPKRIFVQSMGDLFHPEVSEGNIAAVFLRIASLPIHKFLILTKRPERMKDFFSNYKFQSGKSLAETILPNLWIGVTVENDKERHRIDTIRSIPAAVRFVSFEPLLSPIGNIRLQGISWAIIGCESGPNRRPCRMEWIEILVTQCHGAKVPVFVKQAEISGELVKMPEILGHRWSEYPE